MKTLVLILGLLQLGEKHQQRPSDLFKRDFDEVANVYIKNLDPYFYDLVERQYEPLEKNANKESVAERKGLVESVAERKGLVEARVQHFKQLAKNFTTGSYELLSKEMALTYKEEERESIILFFDHALRWEFLGLDYRFFKKTKEELGKK